MPGPIENYKEKDMYNANELGLFNKVLSNETMASITERIEGGNTPKDLLTLLFIYNIEGRDKSSFCIKHFKNPICFPGKSATFMNYVNNKI